MTEIFIADRGWPFLAVRNRMHAIGVAPARGEIIAQPMGAPRAEREVVLAGAAHIRMSLYGDIVPVVGLQPLRLFVERAAGLRGEFGGIHDKEHSIADIDYEILLAPQCGGAHPPGLTRIGIIGTGAKPQADRHLWGAKWPSIGFAVDNREAWPLSYNLGLVGGAGGSLSRLGHFGHSQPEGPAGSRESVPATAVPRAAPPAPAVALAQCGSTVLDLRQSMVRWLAQFASYCETRNGAEVASTGLACLLVLALKSPAPEDW